MSNAHFVRFCYEALSVSSRLAQSRSGAGTDLGLLVAPAV